MIHLNGNLLCVIDTETTGTVPFYHDVIQFACLPLNNKLEPHERHIPFEIKMKPGRPENIEPEALRRNKNNLLDICSNGYEPTVAADLFDDWFERLELPMDKRIMPLAQNWPFDRPFVMDWLGPENFNHRIDGRFRDTLSTALYLNDAADMQSEQVPFPKQQLKYLAACLRIPWEDGAAHDALYDCLKTAEVYRGMRKMMQVIS